MTDAFQEYPILFQLFGAYLNQDYDLNGPDLADSVRAFCREEAAGTRLAARSEIARLLSEHRGREDAMLDAIDSGRTQPMQQSGRDYLRWIDGLLAEASHRHAAE